MSTFSKIKAWFKVSNPHKGYLFGDFIFGIFACALLIIQAIPTAKVVTSLKVADYSGAIMWLCLEFCCVVLYYLCWHISYMFYYKECKYITLNLSDRLYKKIDTTTDAGLASQSKEKLMLKFTVNVSSLQTFSDYLCFKTCYLIKSILTIIIVAFYDIYIALVLFAVIVLMYFWYEFVTNRAQRHTEKIYHKRDIATENVSDIINGRGVTQQLNLQEKNKEKYLNNFDSVLKSMANRGVLNFMRERVTYAVLYIIITAITIWLAVLTCANEITLTTYLVLAPYVSAVIEYAINGYNMLSELQATDVARMRVQTILDMPEEDVIAYANNQTDNLNGNLVFSNISFVPNKLHNDCGKISGANLEIEPKQMVLFCGARGSGKRAIFYLLRRVVVPTTGTIAMDGINILDFNKETYKHNLSYATSKPYFYSESIMDNLLYVCSSKKKIKEVCKNLKIDEQIMALPNGYETNLVRQSSEVSDYLKFMIGLARAILLNAEFICIYEFPNALTKKEKDIVKATLKRLSSSHSIIIFSAGNFVADICDKVFSVTSGKIIEDSKTSAIAVDNPTKTKQKSIGGNK